MRGDPDDWVALLGHLQVQFWVCPDGHSMQDSGGDRPTVQWRDGVAHCLRPGCDRTSASPVGECHTCGVPVTEPEVGDRVGGVIICVPCIALATDGPF